MKFKNYLKKSVVMILILVSLFTIMNVNVNRSYAAENDISGMSGVLAGSYSGYLKAIQKDGPSYQPKLGGGNDKNDPHFGRAGGMLGYLDSAITGVQRLAGFFLGSNSVKVSYKITDNTAVLKYMHYGKALTGLRIYKLF